MKIGSIKEVNWIKCLMIACWLWVISYIGTWFVGGIIFWLWR